MLQTLSWPPERIGMVLMLLLAYTGLLLVAAGSSSTLRSLLGARVAARAARAA